MIIVPPWQQWTANESSNFKYFPTYEDRPAWQNQYTFYYHRVNERQVIAAQQAAEAAQLAEFIASGQILLEVLPNMLRGCGLCYTQKFKKYGTSEEDRISYVSLCGWDYDSYGLYYHIDTFRLPHKITINSFFPKNGEPDISGTLQAGIRHLARELQNSGTNTSLDSCTVKLELDGARPGLWVCVGLVDRRALIPKHVKFSQVYKQLPGNNLLEIPVGVSSNKEFHWIDMDEPTKAHMLVAGMSGGGKSVFLNMLMSSLISNFKNSKTEKTHIIPIDLKMGMEFNNYEGMPYIGGDVRFIMGKDDEEMEFELENEILAKIEELESGKKRKKKIINPIRTVPNDYKPKNGEVLNPPLFQRKVVSEQQHVKLVLLYILSEIKRRGNLFKKCEVKNISGYNRKYPQTPLSRWVVVFDEIAQLLDLGTAVKEIHDLLGLILGVARVLGIHMVLCTQHPNSDVIPGLVKANTGLKVAFFCSTVHQSISIIGDGEAHTLSGHPGEAIFQEGDFRVRLQTPFQSDYLNKQIITAAAKSNEAPSKVLERFGAIDPGEMWQYALDTLGGFCHREKLFNRFGHKGVVERILNLSEVKKVGDKYEPIITIGEFDYYLIPETDFISARKLVKVEEFLATHDVAQCPMPEKDTPLVPSPETPIEIETIVGDNGKLSEPVQKDNALVRKKDNAPVRKKVEKARESDRVIIELIKKGYSKNMIYAEVKGTKQKVLRRIDELKATLALEPQTA